MTNQAHVSLVKESRDQTRRKTLQLSVRGWRRSLCLLQHYFRGRFLLRFVLSDATRECLFSIALWSSYRVRSNYMCEPLCRMLHLNVFFPLYFDARFSVMTTNDSLPSAAWERTVLVISFSSLS